MWDKSSPIGNKVKNQEEIKRKIEEVGELDRWLVHFSLKKVMVNKEDFS